MSKVLLKAIESLKNGEIIAYPTEAVFGLGCDPFNKGTVYRLLQLKQRPINKGLILVASHWEQVESLVDPIPPKALLQAKMTWPGPVTWVFPASFQVPPWIRGENSGVALRISDHPVVKKLCQKFGGPIISTSANIAGEFPAKDYRTVQILFGDQIGFIVPGKVGKLKNPTPIRNAISGEILRGD